jgi:hypothetical protein
VRKKVKMKYFQVLSSCESPTIFFTGRQSSVLYCLARFMCSVPSLREEKKKRKVKKKRRERFRYREG